MDVVSPQIRSAMMARIRGKDTRPEMMVRRTVHRLGYRFRLHRRDLPGCPDLVFSGRRKVILVHGCFWHQHPGCRKATIPQSNRAFWEAKLAANIVRDEQNRMRLHEAGWKTLVIWECEVKRNDLKERVRFYLG